MAQQGRSDLERLLAEEQRNLAEEAPPARVRQ